MTAFFSYSIKVFSCKYLDILLERKYREQTHTLQTWYLHLNAKFYYSQCII